MLCTYWSQTDRIRRWIRLLPDGELDPSFVTSVVTIYHPDTVVQQPDGKYLISGETDGSSLRVSLFRLNSNGTPDPTFAIAPDLFLSGNPNDPDWIDDQVSTIAVQPDGRILVGGSFHNTRSISRGGLLRLNPNGSLDSSFDVGKGATGSDSWPAWRRPTVNRIVLQPDGQILVAGTFHEFDSIPRAHLVRLNGGGNLLTLSARRESDQLMRLQLTGPANQRIVLEAASSLSSSDWQPLSTNTLTTGPLTVPDPDAAKFPQRFYRAVSR